MKVAPLQRAIKILSKVSNQSSISELFRCTEINGEGFRACSEWGNVEIWLAMPDFLLPLLVNTATFSAVINSLPPESEIELKVEQNQLMWKCGSAKGHWGIVILPQSIPIIPSNKEFSWIPPKDFSIALELAGSACQSMTVSVGLFGVVVERLENTIRMTSSNTISLATSQVELNGYPNSETITLRPPVPSLLALLLKSEPEARLAVGRDGIFLLSQNLVAQLPLSSPLDHNIAAVIDRFKTSNDIAKISAKAISQFLNRAKALSDKNVPAEVTLQISGGNILLEQKSVASSSEEYFIAEGIDKTKSFASVVLPMNLMITSLEHVKEAILDFLPSNVLVLRGDKPMFMHIVGGKTTK